MKISLSWLKELVDYDLSPQKLADLLSLKTIGVKQFTPDFLELDLTYNRGDLLSLRGVAREVAAITGSNLAGPELATCEVNKNLPKTPVKVENAGLCSVYCVAKIENLKVEQSDKTWVKKLSSSGMRSVNSVTDVTNLIMLEYGQPMHAFDARGVKDEAIIVRTAKKGERITTLDGRTRDLDISDLLITDSQSSLGIAGVMGGKDSEISETTTTILLEAAIFDPVSIRNTSKRHGLYSEAAKRFIHGLSKTNLLQALAAAIKMYEGLGGKLTAFAAVGDLKDEIIKVELTQERLNSLLDVEIPEEKVESSLKSLGFKLNSPKVTVPHWRRDIAIEEDLIEEVARIYGYDKIPAIPLVDDNPIKINQSFYEFLEKVKSACQETGLTEVSTYSFYSTDVLNNMEIDKKNLIRIANPISLETEYLRFTIWENLLEVASKNIKNGIRDIAIFELGKTYRPKKGGLPDENYELSICLVNGTDNPMQELNKILQNVMEKMNIKIELSEIKKTSMEEKLFHPTRLKYITFKGKPVGGLVEVHPKIVNRFGIEQRAAVVELSWVEATYPDFTMLQ